MYSTIKYFHYFLLFPNNPSCQFHLRYAVILLPLVKQTQNESNQLVTTDRVSQLILVFCIIIENENCSIILHGNAVKFVNCLYRLQEIYCTIVVLACVKIKAHNGRYIQSLLALNPLFHLLCFYASVSFKPSKTKLHLIQTSFLRT